MLPKYRHSWLLRYVHTHTVLAHSSQGVNYQDAFFVTEYVTYTGAPSFRSPSGVVSSPALVRDLSRLVRDQLLSSETVSNTSVMQDVGFPRRSRTYRLTARGLERVQVDLAQQLEALSAHGVEVVKPARDRQLQGSRVFIWSRRPPSRAPHVLVQAYDEETARSVASKALARRSTLPLEHPLCVLPEDVATFPDAGWDLFIADLHHVTLLQRA